MWRSPEGTNYIFRLYGCRNRKKHVYTVGESREESGLIRNTSVCSDCVTQFEDAS